MKKALVKPIKQYGLLVVLIFFYSLNSYAQLSEIRKLQRQLPVVKDSFKYVDVLNRIGMLIHMKNADSCFYYGIKAKSIADRLHYTKGKADALNNIGAALTLKGLYSQALAYYGKAVAEYQKNKDTANAIQTLMNSAITYDFIGDSAKVMQFSQKAISIGARLYPDSIVSMLYANYVNLNMKLSVDSVSYYLNAAEIVAHKYKDDRTLMFIKQLKAYDLLDKKKNKEALPYIEQSLAIATHNKWEYHEMESINMYAQYYLQNNSIDSAIARYNSIYKMSEANSYVYWTVEVLKSLLHCYELKHDEKQQIKVNKLLVAALEKQNASYNSFIGDYIAYNATQEELIKLGQVNGVNKQKIMGLVAFVGIGIIITLLLLLLYFRSNKNARVLTLLNKKINDQNSSLQQTDEFKSKLISMLAHDFRAPLSAAISMVRLLKVQGNDEGNDNELSGLFDHIETDMQNILLTFDNILLWVKKQLSGYVYNAQTLLVYDIMNEATLLFQAASETKNVKFKNTAPKTLSVQTDKEIIQFINRNLIHNALKFSPVGGTITLNAVVLNDEIVFSITDEGKGISPKKLQELFSFKPPEVTDSIEQGGAGVALSICKEFIQKINGRIWVESKNKGETIFFYALPIIHNTEVSAV